MRWEAIGQAGAAGADAFVPGRDRHLAEVVFRLDVGLSRMTKMSLDKTDAKGEVRT
jgi:hypothetical protein